jgi:hypothetical protein
MAISYYEAHRNLRSLWAEARLPLIFGTEGGFIADLRKDQQPASLVPLYQARHFVRGTNNERA